mmetsp:Transcript_32129/g.81860  ORF Transcript_32129/g.81860 Transcript_32129/m.81860 type:complete len:249 (+) Transcript_32129:203-949(+)
MSRWRRGMRTRRISAHASASERLVRHEHERVARVLLAVGLEGHLRDVARLLADEPRRVLAALAGEDEVVGAPAPHVRRAGLVLVLLAVAHAQLDGLARVRRKADADHRLLGDVEGRGLAGRHLGHDVRHREPSVQPQLEVARIAVQLELEVATPLRRVSRLEHGQDAPVAGRGAASEADGGLLLADAQHERRALDGHERRHLEVPVLVVALTRHRVGHLFPVGVGKPGCARHCSRRADELHAKLGLYA